MARKSLGDDRACSVSMFSSVIGAAGLGVLSVCQSLMKLQNGFLSLVIALLDNARGYQFSGSSGSLMISSSKVNLLFDAGHGQVLSFFPRVV